MTHASETSKLVVARRHTRYVEVVGKDGKEIKVRMVYDFEGE